MLIRSQDGSARYVMGEGCTVFIRHCKDVPNSDKRGFVCEFVKEEPEGCIVYAVPPTGGGKVVLGMYPEYGEGMGVCKSMDLAFISGEKFFDMPERGERQRFIQEQRRKYDSVIRDFETVPDIDFGDGTFTVNPEEGT